MKHSRNAPHDAPGATGPQRAGSERSRTGRFALTRRDILMGAGAAALDGYAGDEGRKARPVSTVPAKSAVAIVKAASYSDDLVKRMLEGVRACGLNVQGKRVLLKPNLVEFDPNTCINTDVTVV